MNKYFKPLSPTFYFHLFGACIWIFLLFIDTVLYTWFKIVMLCLIIPSLCLYIKWENIFKQK